MQIMQLLPDQSIQPSDLTSKLNDVLLHRIGLVLLELLLENRICNMNV